MKNFAFHGMSNYVHSLFYYVFTKCGSRTVIILSPDFTLSHKPTSLQHCLFREYASLVLLVGTSSAGMVSLGSDFLFSTCFCYYTLIMESFFVISIWNPVSHFLCRPLKLDLTPEEEVVASMHMDIIRYSLNFRLLSFYSVYCFLRNLFMILVNFFWNL